MLIKYNTGTPTENGVYACRIPQGHDYSGLLEDKFLMWYHGTWSYLRSDLNYRGRIVGWIGPLPRKQL
mgnify:CR=1 FL=1